MNLRGECDSQYIADVKFWFSEMVEDLKAKKLDYKSPQKKVAMIQKYLKSKVFLKYELRAEFHQLYGEGTYNCVTGTAMFALLFDEFKIPYTVLSTHGHVYLIAYPDDENFIVESTTEDPNIYVFNKTFKENYVNMLVDRGTINMTDLNLRSVDELFESYYLKVERINLWNLIGVHYYNSALKFGGTGEYLEAFSQAYKANFFFDDSRSSFLIGNYLGSVSNLLNEQEYTSLLYILTQHNPQSKKINRVAYNFYYEKLEMIYNDKPSDTAVNIVISRAKDCIKDSVLLNDFLYEERLLALDHVSDWNIKKQLPIALEAYQYNSKNARLNALIAKLLMGDIDFEKPREVIVKLDDIIEKYPELEQTESINLGYCAIYGYQASTYFEKKDFANGELYLALFEKKIASCPSEFFVETSVVEEVYKVAALAYAGKRNLARARELLDRGIVLNPENLKLTEMRAKFK